MFTDENFHVKTGATEFGWDRGIGAVSSYFGHDYVTPLIFESRASASMAIGHELKMNDFTSLVETTWRPEDLFTKPGAANFFNDFKNKVVDNNPTP